MSSEICAYVLTICLTGWPAADVEKWVGGLLASPVLKLLLYDAQSWIETPLLWLTEIWLLLQRREQKEDTTFGFDVTALPIGHEEKTTVASVHLGLKTPGRLAGAGSRGYGPETCYSRALMLTVPDGARYCRRCSPLELLNSDYIQRPIKGPSETRSLHASFACIDLNGLLEISHHLNNSCICIFWSTMK